MWRGTATGLGLDAVTGKVIWTHPTEGTTNDRVKKKLAEEGVVWGPSNFDRFHLGDPDIPVVGVATTFQPNLRVLQRALAARKNFVIAHESTFWDGFDPVEAFLPDPVCRAKIRFAEQNHMDGVAHPRPLAPAQAGPHLHRPGPQAGVVRLLQAGGAAEAL
jgi:hypothetical protein